MRSVGIPFKIDAFGSAKGKVRCKGQGDLQWMKRERSEINYENDC